MPARILIVDDHEIVRGGIRTLIVRSRPDWDICGEAGDGEQALHAIQNLKADVVILDITMPKISGLEAASQIAKSGLGCRVLMFTMHESDRVSTEVRHAGAQGFVLKSQAARDLIRAVDCLLSGGTFFGSACEPKTESAARNDRPSLSKSTASCFTRLSTRRKIRFVSFTPKVAQPRRPARYSGVSACPANPARTNAPLATDILKKLNRAIAVTMLCIYRAANASDKFRAAGHHPLCVSAFQAPQDLCVPPWC